MMWIVCALPRFFRFCGCFVCVVCVVVCFIFRLVELFVVLIPPVDVALVMSRSFVRRLIFLFFSFALLFNVFDIFCALRILSGCENSGAPWAHENSGVIMGGKMFKVMGVFSFKVGYAKEFFTLDCGEAEV